MLQKDKPETRVVNNLIKAEDIAKPVPVKSKPENRKTSCDIVVKTSANTPKSEPLKSDKIDVDYQPTD